MRRREFIAGLAAVVGSPPAIVFAQEPGHIYSVGFLVVGSPTGPASAFIDGLGRLGFVEGKNI